MRIRRSLSQQLTGMAVRLVFLLLTFSLLAPAQPQPQASMTAPGDLRNVTVRHPPKRKLPPTQRGFEQYSARVEAEARLVHSGDNVVRMLAENGIRQDATALSLIYDLNPELEDITAIQVGTKLVLPEVAGDARLERALEGGYRVSLERNRAAAQMLTLRNTALTELGNDFSRIDAQSFSDPEDRRMVLAAVSEARGSVEALGNSRAIVSTKVLTQMAVESQAIIATLATVAGGSQPLSREILESIQPRLENLRVTSQEIQAGGSGMVRTEILAKSAATGEPVSELRIWYAPTGDRTLKQPCSRLSSPTTEAIARGEYVFWATRGNVTVSDEVPRKIRKDTRDIPVELQILR